MFVENFQQIASEKLKELFSSFKVVFPDAVPGDVSFASNILKNGIPKLESAIRSLSNGIKLNTIMHTSKSEWPQVDVFVVKVDVVYDGDRGQFCVFRKVSVNKKIKKLIHIFEVQY